MINSSIKLEYTLKEDTNSSTDSFEMNSEG